MQYTVRHRIWFEIPIITKFFYNFIDENYFHNCILKSFISDWLSLQSEATTTAVMQEVTTTIPIEGKSFPYSRIQPG